MKCAGLGGTATVLVRSQPEELSPRLPREVSDSRCLKSYSGKQRIKIMRKEQFMPTVVRKLPLVKLATGTAIMSVTTAGWTANCSRSRHPLRVLRFF